MLRLVTGVTTKVAAHHPCREETATPGTGPFYNYIGGLLARCMGCTAEYLLPGAPAWISRSAR